MAAAMVLGSIPVVSAQLPSEAILIDPVGDVQIDTDGQSASVAGFGPLDLTGLQLTEDPTSFQFSISVADLGDDQATDPQSGYHYVHFSYDGYDFLVQIFRPLDSGSRGDLYVRENETGAFHVVEGVPVFREAAKDTIGAIVDRSLLVALSGKAPGRGDALTSLFITSSHRAEAAYESYGQESPVHVADSMPDEVAEAATWLVRLGGRDGVGAELSSVEPFRASNGEATTYRYVVDLKHLGASNAFYQVQTESVPIGWNVTLPGEVLSIASGKTVDFPVFVTTPFRHQHGATESVTIRVQEMAGEAWASVELGIHFLSIPQPAGHHPELYFHNHPMADGIGRINSAFGGITGQIMMNTQPEDPTAQAAPVYGRADQANTINPMGPVHWAVCLEPQLRMGLDFDPSSMGRVTIPLVSAKPLSGAVLKGQLLLLPPGEVVTYCGQDRWADVSPTVLANFEAAPMALPANGKTVVTMDLIPTPESDYVPYQTGMMLVMAIDLTSEGAMAGVAGAGIDAGGSMRLPLLEYHDTSQVQAKGEESVEDATFTSSEPDTQDSPGIGLIGVLAAVVAGLASRWQASRKPKP